MSARCCSTRGSIACARSGTASSSRRPCSARAFRSWLAARWPSRRPVRRAAVWDGLFPIDLPGPEALAELAAEVLDQRGGGTAPFELVVTNPPGTEPGPWEAAGATWCLTGFGAQPTHAEVLAAIEAGPAGA